MSRKKGRAVRALVAVAVALLATGIALAWGAQTPVAAQEAVPVTISAQLPQAITHTVVSGETVSLYFLGQSHQAIPAAAISTTVRPQNHHFRNIPVMIGIPT